MMKMIVALIWVVLVPGIALAGSGSGKITGMISSSEGGHALFFFRTENVSNVVGGTNRFVLSDTDPHFKTTLATILQAYGTQENVTVVGRNTTNNWYNAEDIHYVVLGNIVH